MSNLILPKDPMREQFEAMHQRITVLSEQVNYLLRTLYRENSNHEVFQRNPALREETKKAVELEHEHLRMVKETVETPEFTREQIKRLNAEMNK
jgi:hypothetical protein